MKLVSIGHLLPIFVVLFFSINCFGNLSGFIHSQQIDIDNSGNPANLTDYSVLVSVNTMNPISMGQMKADGSDIRLTDLSDGLLDFWVESGINTASTKIWVKIPTLLANTNLSIKMQYGNVAATSLSNPEGAFLFFDDFEDGVLDLTKWEVRGMPTMFSESGGMLTVVGNNNWEYVRTVANFTEPVVIHDIRSHVNVSGAALLGYAGTDSRYSFREGYPNSMGTTYDDDISSGNSWFDQLYPAIPHVKYPTFNTYEIIAGINSNNIEISSYCDLTTSNCNTTPTLLNSIMGSAFYFGYTSYAPAYSAISDMVYIRKYSSLEPIVTVMPVVSESIPAISEWGLMILSVLTVIFGMVFLRNMDTRLKTI